MEEEKEFSYLDSVVAKNQAPQKRHQEFTTCIKKTFDRNGKEIGVEFKPTAAMRVFAAALGTPVNNKKTEAEIARGLGYEKNPIPNWRWKIGPENLKYFDDWLEQEIERSRAPLKEMLLSVGREMAAAGDFSFWKELARTEGVISAEKVEQTISVGRLADNLDNLTDAELIERQQKLLQKVQSLEGQGDAAVAGEDSQQRSTSAGAGGPTIEEGSLAILNAVGPNGRQPQRD